MEPRPSIAQLQTLRAFAAVARHGNVHRAAEEVHLSQPAVTRAVVRLEAIVGTRLFERTTRGMHLTAAGQGLRHRVDRALGLLHAAGSALRATAPARAGRERLSSNATGRMLEALVAVDLGGSEAAAAAMLALSQPTLHRNLHQLENLAGATLCRRSVRGTQLTDAGSLLLRHAKLAFAELRVAQEELDALRGQLAGHLVVGVLPQASGHIVTRAVDRTLRDHPDLSITVVDGTYETLIHGLRCAEVDLVLGTLRPPERDPSLAHEALIDDALDVVARAGHPVFSRAPVQRLAELTGESWLAPLPGTPTHQAFEHAFRAESVEPPAVRLHASSPAVVRALLLCSDRLTLMSRRQAQEEIRSGLLVRVPVPVPQAARAIGVIRLRGSQPSPAFCMLLDSLRESAWHEAAVDSRD